MNNNCCRLTIALTLIAQIIRPSSAELTAFKRAGNRSAPIDSSAQYRSFPSENDNNTGDEEEVEDRMDGGNSENEAVREVVNNQAKRHHRHYPYSSYFYYQQQPPNYYQSAAVPTARSNAYGSVGTPCQQQSAYSPYGYYQSASPCSSASATSSQSSGSYTYGSEHYGSQPYSVQQPVVMVMPAVSGSGVDYGYGTGEDFYHFYPDVAWSTTTAAPSSTFATSPPLAAVTSTSAPQEAKPVETPYVGASPPPNSYVLETVLVTPNSLPKLNTLLADNKDDDDVIFKPFQLSTSQPSFALPGSGLAAGVGAKQSTGNGYASRKKFPDGVSEAAKPCPAATKSTPPPENPYDQPQQWLQPQDVIQVAPRQPDSQQNGDNLPEENDYRARPVIAQPPPQTYSSHTAQKPQQPKNSGGGVGEYGNNYYHRNHYHYYQQQLQQQNNGQSLQYWITTTAASPSTVGSSTPQANVQQLQAVVDSQQYWTLLQQLQQQLAQQIRNQQTETKATTIGAPTTTTTLAPISATTTAARNTSCQSHHSSAYHQQTLIKWRPSPSNPQPKQPQQSSPSVAVVASNYLEAIPAPRFQPHISSARETSNGAWQLVKVSNDARNNNRKTLVGQQQSAKRMAVGRDVADETQSAKIKHIPERVVIADRRSLIEFLNRPQTKLRRLSELTRIEKIF